MTITFDGENKIIGLPLTSIMSIREVYSRWVDWTTQSDNMKWLPAFTVIADPPKIPVYITLQNGWLIDPAHGTYGVPYTIEFTEGFLYTNPAGQDPFTPGDPGYELRIIYRNPVAAIGYASGSGVLPADITAIASATKARLEEAGSKLAKVDTITKLTPATL